MNFEVGLKEKFQIHMRNIDGDGYGSFLYIASNKVILDSASVVSAYDEVYAQVMPRLRFYRGCDFIPLANEIVEQFPFLVCSGDVASFDKLSLVDRLFMVDAIHGALPKNPLIELELDDSIYDIPSANEGSFPVPLFDLSSSRYRLMGPYLYNSGGCGKIIWGEADGVFEVDVDLQYIYGVYWKAAEIIDLKMNTWKFPSKLFEYTGKMERNIPVIIDGETQKCTA